LSSWQANYDQEKTEMTVDFGAIKILSKKKSHERERELERLVLLFVGRRVNLALKDGSVIINVILEPLNGKHILRYRALAAGKIQYLPLFSVELITAVSLIAEWLKEAS
jgi:hypothetical protein